MNHDHDLDGKLHDECPMCDLIRSRQRGAMADRQAEKAMEQHQRKAEKRKR